MKKAKAEFHFRDIKIIYDRPSTCDVYYLTDNHEYNKGVNEMVLDFGYVRSKLVKSDFLVEDKLGFEYKRHGVYIKKDHLEERESEKEYWKRVRETDFITNHT